MPSRWGRTLLIANPAAQNGNGAAAAKRAAELLRAAFDERGEGALEVALTEAAGQAVELAAGAGGATGSTGATGVGGAAASGGAYDTVLALGGDGIIHEAANGLMRVPAASRPALGIVPVGSGNDYARTLGMSARSVDAAVAQLLNAAPLAADLGNVNGRWFVETLSFGLDAAIALDTVERRVRTGRTGTVLYLESGFDQLFHHLRSYRYAASLDGGPAAEDSSITFAVQVGPSYGGGFAVCPDARIDDGVLDLCIAHPPVSAAKAALIFLMAKGGRHGGFRQIEFARARTLHVEFDEAPPAQVDGERIEARAFDVRVEPHALTVLVPTTR